MNPPIHEYILTKRKGKRKKNPKNTNSHKTFRVSASMWRNTEPRGLFVD
jgi:hypothetical protein